ncbi:flagellin [Geothrix oryzae]|jgi:flagellin|uniref:Flagellin n=1 Tax=Geothrix oryzae TaxID=2927975 RepID=A0ABM8DM39_9BACT|nr:MULTISPECIES: flagellin [Geothrix]BDU67972.1 flagellin [Geothrix oryzae]
MSVLNNVAALGAARQIGVTSLNLQKTVERLSTGKRINRANDDAAGLSIANTLGADARVATQASRNAMDGYFQVQTADSYMEEATALATRAAELESAYKGADTAGKTAIDAEYKTIGDAITKFDGQRATITADAGVYGSVTATKTAVTALAASAASGNAATVLADIAKERGNYGAVMTQLQSYGNSLATISENKTAQYDQIMGADIGAEVVKMSKFQILNQAGISALSQANSAGQSVLALLR